jgi:acetyltransferase-like isoleucine patch superfamily enzyme
MRLILLKILTRLGRIWIRSQGVKLGRGGWIHGLPEIRRIKGSLIQIGDNVTLCSLARLNPLSPNRRISLVTNTPAARIIIKDGAGIGSSVLSCSVGITIGCHARIGADCVIADTDFHGFPLDEAPPVKSAPIEIGDYVFIGTRSIILKGVKIGNRSVIGAGSVVTSSIPENSLAAGNPARVIRAFAPK